MKKLLKAISILLVMAMCLSGASFAFAEDTVEFADVSQEDYFYPAVMWGVESGITYGTGDNLFEPNGHVTRAQVVTFLWRMAGEPAAETNETFTDVAEGSWYEPAVAWAVENGITLGTGEGLFSPGVVCDRAMCITLLYRVMGSPLDEAAASEKLEFSEDMSLEELGIAMAQSLIAMVREADIFSDVPENSYYELPVIWAAINGVITEDNTGVMEEGTLFRSGEACVRKEMISFLYQTKLLKDQENAPEIYDFDPVSIAIPKEYSELLYREMFGLPDDENGTIITVSELASREAAEAMGEDPEGAGELFSIERVNEETLHAMLWGDMSGKEVFAKDEDGYYYLYCHPTDVRYLRETNEKMAEDQEQWTKLNEWAYTSVREDILKYSEGLSEYTYTNTSLDMHLAGIAFHNDTNYTISTTEFGPLKPGKTDVTSYALYLLDGNFVVDEDAEIPDGEYVVLDFHDDGVRYDFFKTEPNLVREVNGEYVTLYRRVIADGATNTEIMQEWYDAVAKNAGKK